MALDRPHPMAKGLSFPLDLGAGNVETKRGHQRPQVPVRGRKGGLQEGEAWDAHADARVSSADEEIDLELP